MKALLLAALVALSACATAPRTTAYEGRDVDAVTLTDEGHFSVWLHPTDDSAMIGHGLAQRTRNRAVDTASLGVVGMREDYSAWMAAARGFVAPAGCQVISLSPLKDDELWEFTYTCPAGVSLRALVAAQRDALLQGEALQPPPPAPPAAEPAPTPAT